MKHIILKGESLSNRISYYLLCCFLIALPFERFYSELILACFIAHTIIHLKKERVQLLLRKEVLVIAAIYIAGLAAILYSADSKQGINDAVKQLAILFLPAALVVNEIELKKYQPAFLKTFAYACTTAIFYLYADAFRTIQYYKLPFKALFTAPFMNHNFCTAFDIHATYLSMYVAFAAACFLFYYFSANTSSPKWHYLLCSLFLTAGLLQLSSRAVSIAFLLIIFMVFPAFLVRGKRRTIFLMTAMVALFGILAFISTERSFKEKYIDGFRKDLSQYQATSELTESRMKRWNIAFALIKKSPLTGYGSGSETRLLKEQYFEKKLYSSYLHEFNAHSEYLSLLLKTGIIGLAVYLFALAYGSTIAWKTRNTCFAAFLVLLIVTSFTENILDLNKGIFFFSFFFPFFLLTPAKEATVFPDVKGNRKRIQYDSI